MSAACFQIVDSVGKTVKGATRKTSTILKTLAPVWSDATFEFEGLVGNAAALLAADALDGKKGSAVQLAACLQDLSLRVSLFDADTMSSDALGQVELKLDFLAAVETKIVPVTSWHDLKGTFGGKQATGSIELELARTPPPPPPLGEKLQTKQEPAKVDGEMYFEEFDFGGDDHDDVPQPNVLKVAIIAGRGLIAADMALLGPSTSDPLAKIKVVDPTDSQAKSKAKAKKGAWAASTRVIKETLEPKWNETFDLNVRALYTIFCSGAPKSVVRAFDFSFTAVVSVCARRYPIRRGPFSKFKLKTGISLGRTIFWGGCACRSLASVATGGRTVLGTTWRGAREESTSRGERSR